ncbi:MAG TPA: DciA family protein [Aestuariivirga sp.]
MERLDKHFEKLTKASFARYGFAYGELMARWPEIVGGALAQHSEPERIKWPRGSGENAQKLGGTLVIRAEPGRGLDLQYQTHQIIERINQFYGYGAITSVKIMQGHVASTKPLKNKDNYLDSKTEEALDIRLESIADERLKEALHRLGAGALAKRLGSPHEK